MQLPVVGKVRRPAPWLVGLLAAGVLGAGTATYFVVQHRTAAPDISNLTVTVDSQPLTVRITASGTVQPIQTVNLSPKNAGILQELYVEQGDRVTQGQVIARMQSDSIQAELVQSQARVGQAQARLAELRAGNRPQEIAQNQAAVEQVQARVLEAQARVNRADERVSRNQQLASEGAISQDDLDAVLNDLATAQATLRQNQASLREAQQQFSLTRSGSRAEDIAEAEAQLKEAQGNLQAVQVQLEDTIIRAPFDGIVTQKYATEGAFVTPTTSASEATSATSTAIVAIANGVEVLAEVPEVDINQIKLGQKVEIVADAYPDQVFQGQVRLVAPEAVVKQNVTSFQVRVELVTGETKLLSGMNVDMTFLGDRLNSALTVPTVAIVTKDGQTGVLIPSATNQVEFRPVKLGNSVGDQTQILEGLKPGDRVFIDLPADQKQKWMNPNANEASTNK
ncbi:MAG TPA: efflux RND transporter periplasmic adaptor subunit [Crinalium sp.]